MTVRQLDGIKNVDGDVKSQTVTVGFDPDEIGVDDIVSTMNDMGYPATVVSS